MMSLRTKRSGVRQSPPNWVQPFDQFSPIKREIAHLPLRTVQGSP